MGEGKIRYILDDADPRSLEQRIDDLGNEIIAMLFLIIDRRLQGEPVVAADEEKLIDLQRMFKYLKNTYTDLVKMGRIKPVPNEEFDSQLLQRIKEKKSTMGNIVTKIPK